MWRDTLRDKNKNERERIIKRCIKGCKWVIGRGEREREKIMDKKCEEIH